MVARFDMLTEQKPGEYFVNLQKEDLSNSVEI